jgi:hypothetical protein
MTLCCWSQMAASGQAQLRTIVRSHVRIGRCRLLLGLSLPNFIHVRYNVSHMIRSMP